MNEPNTEPPPPPPEPPKARHPLAWLVFLLPSAVTLFAVATQLEALFLTVFGLSLGSCFYLGYVMDRWLHKEVWHPLRTIGWGFGLLVLNLLVSFAGCVVIGNL